jgi:hypothetical protein
MFLVLRGLLPGRSCSALFILKAHQASIGRRASFHSFHDQAHDPMLSILPLKLAFDCDQFAYLSTREMSWFGQRLYKNP